MAISKATFHNHFSEMEEFPCYSSRTCRERRKTSATVLLGITIFTKLVIKNVGWDSAVGIATHYGLDNPGSNPGGGRDFPHLSRPALVPTHPPIEWLPGHSKE